MAYLSEAARYARGDGGSFTANASTNYLHGYPAGTLVCLAVNAPTNTAWTSMTATDSAGNTYTQIGTVDTSAPANYLLARFYCVLTHAVTTSDSITATTLPGGGGTNSAKWTILAAAFDDATTFDVQTMAVGGSTAPNSGNVTGGAANQLLFGAVAYTDGTGAVGITAGSGWTNGTKATASPSSGGRSTAIGWRHVTTGGSRSYTSTLASSQGWAAAVAAFTLDGEAEVTYTRSYQVVIDATGTTSPSLTQASGPSATIDSSGSPVFVITEPTPFTSAMSFTLNGTEGSETIVVDPRGTDQSGRLVWNGSEWG